MTARRKVFRFDSEAAMCAAFIADADRQGWTAYPETGGFDILLHHRATGLQVGVEAKQQFNTKVLLQITDTVMWGESGPDFRAVLVPEGGSDGLDTLAHRLGVTVIRCSGQTEYRSASRGGPVTVPVFAPSLPQPRLAGEGRWFYERGGLQQWTQQFPPAQLTLPEYVPDVAAGASAPVALTEWKVRAIKIAVVLDQRGFVTRADFKALEISMSRWTQSRWITKRGDAWVRGEGFPDFRAQHPRNFDEIAADFDRWSKLLPATLPAELPL